MTTSSCNCSVVLAAVLIHDSVDTHHHREPSSVAAILDGLDRERGLCRRSDRSCHVCGVAVASYCAHWDDCN